MNIFLKAKRLQTIMPDFLICLSLVFAEWKYTFGLNTLVDLSLYDETAYLVRGATLLQNGFPHPEDAPLSAMWYAFLARFTADRIALFFQNYVWMTILPPLLLYLVLRRYRVSILASALVALFFLITYANLPVIPKVNHFALIILLIFLIAASFFSSLSARFAILAIGCLFASYVRPELYYGFGLCLFISAGLIIHERKWRNGFLLALCVSIAIGLGFGLGNPLSGNGRSIVAFGQHFGLNWTTWTNNTQLSPWTDWQQILESNFGEVSSISDAVSHNPGLVLRHIYTNGLNAPRVLYTFYALHASLILPSSFRYTEANLLPAIVIIALLLQGKALVSTVQRNWRKQYPFLALIGVLLLFMISVVLLIYPRPHYLVILGALLLCAFVVLIDPFQSHLSIRQALLVALIIGVVIPNATALIGVPRSRPILETIQFLRGLHITEPVRLLEADGGYSSYMPGNYTSLAQYNKAKPFNAFVQEQKINMVLVNDRLTTDSRYRDDAEFKTFLDTTYQTNGFERIPLPDGVRFLYVQKDLLPSTK